MDPPGETLIGEKQIAQRVAELARLLGGELRDELEAEGVGLDEPGRVVLVPVLSGAMVFFADLIRRLPPALSMSTEPVAVRSYSDGSTRSQGARLLGEGPANLGGKHVVIVDDILDTGRTLSLLDRRIREQSPASLRICVFLRKERRREEPIDADLVGFDIPDVFVIGYGLDFDGRHRNLPDLRVLASPERSG